MTSGFYTSPPEEVAQFIASHDAYTSLAITQLLEERKAEKALERAASLAVYRFRTVFVPPGPDRKGRSEEPFGVPFEAAAARAVPKRHFVYGKHRAKRYVSMTIGAGGHGKSALLMVEVLAHATGRPLLGEDLERSRVFIWNGEDPLEETLLRLLAAAEHYGVAPEELEGWVFVGSGRLKEIALVVANGSTPIKQDVVFEQLADFLIEQEIDVAIFDPLVATARVDENASSQIDALLKMFGKLAEEANCAVEIVHHSRKTGGREVTGEDARGSSAMLAAVRSARTLNRMAESDAAKLGVSPGEAWRYVRIDNAKANLAPPTKARWFRLDSHNLANGDSVGVPVPWSPLEVAALSEEEVQKVLTALAGGGPWQKSRQGANWIGCVLGKALGLAEDDPQRPFRAEQAVKFLAEGGHLVEDRGRVKGRDCPIYRLPGR